MFEQSLDLSNVTLSYVMLRIFLVNMLAGKSSSLEHLMEVFVQHGNEQFLAERCDLSWPTTC